MSKRIVPSVVVVAIVGALFLANNFLFDHIVEDLVGEGLGTAAHGIQSLASYSSESVSGLFSIQALIEENESLRAQAALLMQRDEDIETLKQEISELEAQLDVDREPEGRLRRVSILSVDRNATVSEITIQGGEDDGFSDGMLVFAPGNILAGEIIDVFAHTSRVRLLDDPHMQYNVRIRSTGGVSNAVGRLNGTIELGFLAQSEIVSEGDTVTTSGLDAFPAGFVIGTISDIRRVDSSLFLNVYATLVYDPALYQHLFVLEP